jgi:hypothetical protein
MGYAKEKSTTTSQGDLWEHVLVSEQSYAAVLRQGTQNQQPQALQTYGESERHPVQQHLPQQEIQKTGLSIQAPSSTNSETLKFATVVHQIMTELSEMVSEEDKIMVIKKMVLNLMKQNA